MLPYASLAYGSVVWKNELAGKIIPQEIDCKDGFGLKKYMAVI